MNRSSLLRVGFVFYLGLTAGCGSAPQKSLPGKSSVAQQRQASPSDQQKPPVEGTSAPHVGPEKVTQPTSPAKLPTAAPPEVTQRSPAQKPPSVDEEELRAFGAALIEAIRQGAGEAYCMTMDDLAELHTPATARILQMGRVAWLRSLEKQLGNAEVKFLKVERGPRYRAVWTVSGGNSPFRMRVPFIHDLRIQITVNGNPGVLVIDTLYRLPGGWRVFQAHLED